MCDACYAAVMVRSRSFGIGLAISALIFVVEPASACVFWPNGLHQMNAELYAQDALAPDVPVLVGLGTFRRTGLTCTLTSCVWNSCGDTGTVRIDLAATDDVTPEEQLGYRLEVVSGSVPASISSAIGINLAGDGPLILRPSFEEVSTLDVTLRAIAIDGAGNESAPSEAFTVRFDGCTLAAVGDACEDALEPETDLSALALAQELGDEWTDPDSSEPLAGGGSCALAARSPQPSLPGLFGIGLGLGVLGVRRACRARAAPCRRLAPLAPLY
jgi:hypothetical protein